MKTFVGVDYHKHYSYGVIMTEDRRILKQGKFPNHPEAVAEFVGRHGGHECSAVLEATRGWTVMHDWLEDHAGRVVLAHPMKLKAIAEARIKTDRIDAQTLARFAQVIRPPLRPVADESMRQIRQLVVRRRQLVDMRQAEANRTEHAREGLIRRSIRQILKAVDAQIEAVEQAIAACIQRSPLWRRRVEILASIPGLAQRTAESLVANLPELGMLNRRQAAALAGVAPINRDSGMLRGKRSTAGGRTAVRNALYMPTLAAIRHNPLIKDFYQRLLKNGKAKMTAVIAAMRKLLTIINALIRENRTWNQNYD
jgi:transposase